MPGSVKTGLRQTASAGASRAAADRIAEAMQAIPFRQYRSARVPASPSARSGLDDLHEGLRVSAAFPRQARPPWGGFEAVEIQGPRSRKRIKAHYDPDVACVPARGRKTAISVPSDAVWCQPQHAQNAAKSRDSFGPSSSDAKSAIPHKLNGRLRRCSSGKQSLQARLLAQVLTSAHSPDPRFRNRACACKSYLTSWTRVLAGRERADTPGPDQISNGHASRPHDSLSGNSRRGSSDASFPRKVASGDGNRRELR